MIILGTNSIKDTGFDVANSLRFNDDSTDYLSRTPGSDGNRKTWTFSTWIKRGNIGIGNPINVLGGEDGASRYSDIMIGTPHGADDTFWFKQDTGTVAELRSTMKLRDPAAWYHLVFTYDSTDSTAADRMKMYVNGVRLTSFVTETNVGSNVDSYVNTSGDLNYIGIYQASSKKLDAYLCETVLIDGTALAADSFGEFDSDSGIWKPIDVSDLTFGTNGFYMEYKESGTGTDASGMGADTSGNTNHFAVSNLTSVDQSTDTCTNNFATLNPLNVPTSNAPTFSEGNLQSVSSSSASGAFGGSSTIGVSSGKWYIETKCLTSGHTQSSVGVTYNDAETARVNSGGTLGYEYSYRMNGNKGHDDTDSSYGDTYTTNDIIGIALDLDNNKIYFSKNGTFQNSGDPESGATGTGAAFTVDSGQTYMFYHQDNTGATSNTSSVSFNFGSPAYSESGGETDGNGYGNFAHAVPANYYSLNTKNLAEYG